MIDGDGVMVTLDQGDANPRTLVMNIHPDYRQVVANGFDGPIGDAASIDLVSFPIVGNLHYNYTGAYVGGLELSGTHYVATANLYAAEFEDEQGIMVCAVDKKTHAVTNYQLASGGGYSCPQMMKFSNDKLLVLWEDKSNQTNIVYYSFLDGTGKPAGGVKTVQGHLSDCKPILANGRAVWYTTGVYIEQAPTFYMIDDSGNLTVGAVDPSLLPSPWAREQAAAMLYRLAAAAGKPFPEASATFDDMGSVSSWASQAVGTVQAAGIMSGVGSNRFDPKGAYTYEQSIATMLRMYHYLNQ